MPLLRALRRSVIYLEGPLNTEVPPMPSPHHPEFFPMKRRGVLLGRQWHHSSLLCHCRLPKSCFNVLNPKFIFSQPQQDLAHSTLGQGLSMGNPGARLGVGLTTVTGLSHPCLDCNPKFKAGMWSALQNSH